MSITIALPIGFKPVIKHGEHDQSSHGSWATGNFDEDTDGAEAQDRYFERYGFDTKTGEPTGVSNDEIRSIDDYTAEGYSKINGYLRGSETSPYEEGSYYDQEYKGIMGNRITDIDKLIEESPDMFGDKNLYRVFSKNVLDSLQEGDVLTDKGYLSTTRVDITSEAGNDVLQSLELIRESADRAAIILPSESKSGKGIAVDYLKNAVPDKFTNVSTANNEKEVLLPRGTSLKFLGYKRDVGTQAEVAVFQRLDK